MPEDMPEEITAEKIGRVISGFSVVLLAIIWSSTKNKIILYIVLVIGFEFMLSGLSRKGGLFIAFIRLFVKKLVKCTQLIWGMRIMAGFLIVSGALLTLFFNGIWLILTIFAGSEMVFSAFTGWCPSIAILEGIHYTKLGAFLEKIGCRPESEEESQKKEKDKPKLK
ncbi:MAG TPA: DUF2892 domain-containing protein [Candidatus Nanoarchaeia archaeon]|nr:DUF2892 domain-containing protein [Candidatus Nanoarchaeia archaeon]